MTYRCCGKEYGHASWCTSTARMLAGENVTYTPVTMHVVTIDEDAPAGRYRWRCSCRPDAVGRWVTRRWQAVQGGKTHERRSFG